MPRMSPTSAIRASAPACSVVPSILLHQYTSLILPVAVQVGEALRSRGSESMAASPVSWSRLITIIESVSWAPSWVPSPSSPSML